MTLSDEVSSRAYRRGARSLDGMHVEAWIATLPKLWLRVEHMALEHRRVRTNTHG